MTFLVSTTRAAKRRGFFSAPADAVSFQCKLSAAAAACAILAAMIFPGCTSVRDAELTKFRFEQEHMGTQWSLTLFAASEPAANAAAEAAFARVNQLDRLLSDYSPDSEVSKLSGRPAGSVVPVSSDTADALGRALAISRDTGGAFDPTVGPVVALWRTARRARLLPAKAEIKAAQARTGWESISLDAKRRTVLLLKGGLKLDLGAIAKGYAADAALRVLRENGCPRALVAASGDLAIGDPPPGRDGWLVAVEPPASSSGSRQMMISLRNCGVSTSGDVEQFVEIGGVRYSHIVDAHTGIGLTNRVQATVIARDAATSDALATALCVMGSPAAIEFANKHRHLEAVTYEARPDGVREERSEGFPTPTP